jgi:hypothetical protein
MVKQSQRTWRQRGLFVFKKPNIGTIDVVKYQVLVGSLRSLIEMVTALVWMLV